MLANMDAWAKPFELAPGVVIKILPFKPVFWQSQYDTFVTYLHDHNIKATGTHDIFIFTAPLSTSLCVEPDAELSIALRVFIAWFNGRTQNVIENWHSFEQMVDNNLVVRLWEAYTDTRDDLPKAPAVLQKPAPLPVDNNGNVSKPIKTGGRK